MLEDYETTRHSSDILDNFAISQQHKNKQNMQDKKDSVGFVDFDKNIILSQTLLYLQEYKEHIESEVYLDKLSSYSLCKYMFDYNDELINDKQYIALVPYEIYQKVLPVKNLEAKDFVFRITLDYNTNKNRYGTVNQIELGRPLDRSQYTPTEVVQLLNSPECFTEQSNIERTYSAIIFENYNYFIEQCKNKKI